MRAHLVQMDIAWEDREANRRKVETLLDSADVGESDLVVLPELFDSGFSLNTSVTADRDGSTLAFLLGLSEDLGCVIQGSRTVLSCDCAKATNRASIVGPGGLLREYSKIHPFSYGREGEAFVGGGEVVTYRWEGTEARRHEGTEEEAERRGDAETEWKSAEGGLVVCPAVCYDLRFPELFRAGLAAGAEVFALGANWPDGRQAHWRALLVARAIENQAFVLGVNRTGPDPHLNYVGGSIAVDPKGGVLGELGDEEAVLTVEIDPGTLRAWRDEFPAWKDRRL